MTKGSWHLSSCFQGNRVVGVGVEDALLALGVVGGHSWF